MPKNGYSFERKKKMLQKSATPVPVSDHELDLPTDTECIQGKFVEILSNYIEYSVDLAYALYHRPFLVSKHISSNSSLITVTYLTDDI